MKRVAVVPTPRLRGLIAFCAMLALAGPLLSMTESSQSYSGPLAEAAWVVAVVALLLALWDATQSRRLSGIQVERDVTHSLAVNSWRDVTLRISHQFPRPLTIELFDFYPADAETKFLPQQVSLIPGQYSELRYRFRPLKRGPAEFALTQLLIPSPMGLWSCSRMCGEPSLVRVYPNFTTVTHYQLLATDNHTSQLGIKRKPRRGEGLEFHQLRDYRQGDSLRQIDWKASVRRQKLISKEYQDERDQQLFFMLDCGRRMRAQDDDLSHFDHALNALLLLSYVALRQGDAVGLMSFGGQRRWLAPQKSAVAVNAVLNTVYDLQPTTHATDYLSATQELLLKQRKRSLIVIMTNLHEEGYADLLPAIRLLRRRHLVLLANLREQATDQVLASPIRDFDEALGYLGALNHVHGRQQVQGELQRQGVLSIDTVPAELAVRVVNSYLEIKRSGGL